MSCNNRELSIKDADVECAGDDNRGHMRQGAPLTQSEEYKAGEGETSENW